MAPYIEKMKNELKDKITVISIDVDQNEALADALKIDGLPTLILYDNQKSIWKNEGFIAEEDLRKKL
jgi:thioredoxin-like negative regulator of GroEL